MKKKQLRNVFIPRRSFEGMSFLSGAGASSINLLIPKGTGPTNSSSNI